jgi:hypothetical protein
MSSVVAKVDVVSIATTIAVGVVIGNVRQDPPVVVSTVCQDLAC